MTSTLPVILRLRKGTPLLATLVAAVNQGIDAHLEAITRSKFEDCGSTFEAHIDPADLPCLLRRLSEIDTPASNQLAEILRQRSAVQLDEFTQHYITAALWSTNDEPDERGGDPLEDNYGPEDFAPEALARIIADCQQFQEQHGIPQYNDPRYTDAEKAGHDFWLTRNGHGAGFWDRDELSEADQTRYTEAAKAFGECYIYVGDDGKLYVS